MKRLFSLCLAVAIGLGTAASARAQLQPPEVAARSYLLLDMTSNQILAARDPDAPADPASLTKLMTAYVVFGAVREKKISLEQRLPVSVRAWDERKGGASVMFIEPRMQVSVEDLLKGMIVVSGNDAAVALAEGVAGSVEAFVEMMNREAQRMGLKNTTFKNVTGITEPGHVSTARDLATIASRIITDFPEFFPLYSMREYRFNNITQPNRNLLLRRDPSVDGMKTGYTAAAGYCLIATAQREFPNGKRRLLSVVLNTTSMEARASESQKLLNWGYQAFDALKLFDANQAIVTPPVWKGTDSEVKLGSPAPVYVTVPKGDADKVKTQVERIDPLVAPLAKGQSVGKLKVVYGNNLLAEVPLVVLDPVKEAGIFGRAWDAIRLWIK
ncbi:D-alanyl-D-alanine carboxypeptidase [Caldimonas thermodepolymerans]|jgi:D-alanyl-D-alanine carboxypeptidase (penicillin-binding protein 5/6)|uniref:serine-type D-Ala-D-Ala carboxypeptidase n=1 Tax=Caldimonas thermodepolymerans TaxID=215580 RepID=A0A2S5T5G7_9BURK|nr:D-alanyl-D-alanine carboxypeptidase family protein [Caldimonas thermodepolymerans]PPE70221.1 peptidase [Caldimonas thermodepolymerans]QPC32216.1 D-alanyl-D-alanine carboxypeptidase [Caldimonas thermodepolymerans]RDH98105.1 penicillin-binding protein 6 [Caldimonas thermodepolymerans]TCP08120.1 penicillin-binding protein 6 [Caldimonas thermodepolymerans]UZG48761.1 D-alanyl-D-alanine carboxypeptidase [Caldimonas thermodepolymerans]